MIQTRESLIAEIEALPSRLDGALGNLPDAQLDTPYREGGWTLRQLVHHLADSHMNAFIRMHLVLTEDHPTLKPYSQEVWAELPDYRGPISTSLSILRGLHERWVTMLRSVPDDAWSRTGFHPEHGTVTLEWLLESYGNHSKNHFEHVQMGLQRAGSVAA